MSTSIRYLRLYLHRPAQANGTAGRREAIGYLSQYGDILRVSFDEAYIRNPQRPTLSLSFQGADEAATPFTHRASMPASAIAFLMSRQATSQ